jgi:hypothetical protein
VSPAVEGYFRQLLVCKPHELMISLVREPGGKVKISEWKKRQEKGRRMANFGGK